MATKGSHFIDGRWITGDGEPLISINPGSGEAVWAGRRVSDAQVMHAMDSAFGAWADWAGRDVSERIRYLESLRVNLEAQKSRVADAISLETGKPRWEAFTEADSMLAKVGVSVDAYHDRCGTVAGEFSGASTEVRYRPHGVIAVLGPFNFPGHLPHGQIVPAVLAGNTVVFKPSTQAPLVGEVITELWESAGIPRGVVNLVQGGRQMGATLSRHHKLAGLFFTGSAETGRAIHRVFSGRPEVILALEMGGNNPLVVHEVCDFRAAAYVTVLSAYLTSGQRCSCARRLIVTAGPKGDRFVDELVSMIGSIRVGLYTDQPEPFMGPVISVHAAAELMEAQARLKQQGARILCPMEPQRGIGTLLTPGLIDVSSVPRRPDQELFGPLLQLIRVPDFHTGLDEANRTSYGLAAGLLSDDRALWERFRRVIRAGVVYWNRPTTGAGSRLPFGGIGASGNHRPGAYFAADFCSYPVAIVESDRVAFPETTLPGIDL